MAETKESLQLTIDSKSLILSHLTTDSYFMDRGPRYEAYAQLRESKLREKQFQFIEEEQELEIPRSEITPVKKSVRFQEDIPRAVRKQRSSVLAQSVPDFSSAMKKENRKPVENQANRVPKVKSITPPPPSISKREKVCGSKSVNSGEKQSNGKLMMMGRKSYASIEELKGLSIAASNAINGENRGGKKSNVLRKSTILSTRYY